MWPGHSQKTGLASSGTVDELDAVLVAGTVAMGRFRG